MKLSMHTYKLERRFGAIAAVRMLADAGFDGIDYSMYTSDLSVFGRGGAVLISEMRRIAESRGASFCQAHAPYSDYAIGDGYEEKNRVIFNGICRSITIAARLGAPMIVIHPAMICPRLTADQRFEMNMELYSRYLSVARGEGIKICIENICRPDPVKKNRYVGGGCSTREELTKYVEALAGEGVLACIDVGHAGLVGENAVGMIRALGDRIGCIHLHDNDFVSDSHLLPYLGEIDFDGVCRALGRVHFDGSISLEAEGFIRNMPDSVIPSALLLARNVASHIRNEITKYSQTY